ncbi:MAG: PocR ligand-binding domain-containing protein [Syntrophobacteria bacterium]
MSRSPLASLNFVDLVDHQHIQELLCKLTRVTGVAATLIDNEGNAICGEPSTSAFCPTYMRMREPAPCQQFFTNLCREASGSGKMLQSTCPFDLTVGLAPIHVDQQVLAHVKCGHVFNHLPSPSRICDLADLLQVEVEPYRQALMKQRIMADSDFSAVMELGWEIAQTISQAADHNLEQKRLQSQLRTVTRERLSEKTLDSKATRERYRRLFRRAPLVAYTLDSQLRTLYISPYCHKVFGYRDDEVRENLGFWDQHIHSDDRQRVHSARAHYLSRGESFTLEYRIIHRNCSVRHIINHSIPVRRNNRIKFIDGFVFDITARKRLEKQQVLTEKIKVLSDMSLSVAHEIRNPLTSIGGFARLLDRRMEPEDPNRSHLEIILKEVARLEATLNQVLDNFKRIRLQPVSSNINKILTRVLNQLHYDFLHRGIQVTTNFNTELPEVEVDQHLIEQALRSIIETTLQRTETGRELTVTTSHSHLHIVIEIKGICLDSEPAEKSQLFFPFYREPAFDSRFGLPLSQQIIAEHGGNVVFRNGFDRHPSLVISLPVTENQHP